MSHPHPRRWFNSGRRAHQDERGSISVFAVVAVVALMIMIGLVVDGGGRIQALQRADGAAREAARQAGQAIQAGPAIRGQAVIGDAGIGRAAAQSYLANAGVSGSVQVSGTRIQVTTSETYNPIFLSIIGIGSMTVSGHAEARIVRDVQGVER